MSSVRLLAQVHTVDVNPRWTLPPLGPAASTLEGCSLFWDVPCDPHHQEPAPCLWSFLGSDSANLVPQGSASAATTPRARPVSAACQVSMATPLQAKPTTASLARALDSRRA